MVRFGLLSFLLVAGLASVVAWRLLLSGPGGTDFENSYEDVCDTTDQVCIDYLNHLRDRLRPTEAPIDPRVKQVLVQDPAIEAMVGSLQEGVDYWIDITGITNGLYGDEGGWVTLAFQHPISYEGPLGTASEPCAGRELLSDDPLDDEFKGIAPDDPCRQQPRMFGSKNISLTDVRIVHAQVDIKASRVFDVYADDSPYNAELIDDQIDYFRQRDTIDNK